VLKFQAMSWRFLHEDEKVLFSIRQRDYRPAINIESATITKK
jgi:hypothetical protein